MSGDFTQARARIVHVDIDPAEINKNKASHVTVCADTKPCLAVRILSMRLLLFPDSCSCLCDSPGFKLLSTREVVGCLSIFREVS